MAAWPGQPRPLLWPHIPAGCAHTELSPPLCALIGLLACCRQPALGPTRAIRLGLLRAKQAELESLQAVLAQCEARNAELAATLADRRRAAQELAAKAQVGGGVGGTVWRRVANPGGGAASAGMQVVAALGGHGTAAARAPRLGLWPSACRGGPPNMVPSLQPVAEQLATAHVSSKAWINRVVDPVS